jgi:hypothetical protein
MSRRSDEGLRAILVAALTSWPDRKGAGAVLDRWDELTLGMPMVELLTAVRRDSQKRVITLYAAEIERQSPALLASEAWGVVNRAIVERWSENALKRIKLAAWRSVESKSDLPKLAQPL